MKPQRIALFYQLAIAGSGIGVEKAHIADDPLFDGGVAVLEITIERLPKQQLVAQFGVNKSLKQGRTDTIGGKTGVVLHHGAEPLRVGGTQHRLWLWEKPLANDEQHQSQQQKMQPRFSQHGANALPE